MYYAVYNVAVNVLLHHPSLSLVNVDVLKANKTLRDCLARVKKRHKCKFVPRLLSMIVVS